MAAIRPEDVVLGSSGVEVTVEVAEYHGREIAAEARTAEGLQLHLRTSQRLAPGDKVQVTLPPERLLVFPA